MNANAAAFVSVIAIGVLFAIGAAAGFWLVDRVGAHFERTEVDDMVRTDSGGHVTVDHIIRAHIHDGDVS